MPELVAGLSAATLYAQRVAGAGVPVQPDGDQARQWAIDELAKTVYQEAKPSWVDQLLAAALDWIMSLLAGLRGVNANLGIVIIIVAAALVIGVSIWRLKPRANRSHAADKEVFDDGAARSAAEYRDAARRAADDGFFSQAVLEQFRAIVRSAEERTIIDVQPGGTANEVTDQLVGAFEASAPSLRDASALFNTVRYGNSLPQGADFDRLVDLDLALQRRSPRYERGARESQVSPR